MEHTNSKQESLRMEGVDKQEKRVFTNCNGSSPVSYFLFVPSSWKERRAWAVGLQIMIAEKSKLSSNCSKQKGSGRDLCLYSSPLPKHECSWPLLGSGRVKEDHWGLELSPRSGPWTLSFLFNTIISAAQNIFFTLWAQHKIFLLLKNGY